MEKQRFWDLNKLWLLALSALVLFSLALNGFLLFSIERARDAALEAVAVARNQVATLSQEPLIVPIKVEQSIPISTVISIDQSFNIPLDFEYNLSTTVNTSVNIPLLGRQNISFPVDTVIPIQYTFQTPIRVDVPISLTYDLQTEIPVAMSIPPEIRASLDNVLAEIEAGLK